MVISQNRSSGDPSWLRAWACTQRVQKIVFCTVLTLKRALQQIAWKRLILSLLVHVYMSILIPYEQDRLKYEVLFSQQGASDCLRWTRTCVWRSGMPEVAQRQSPIHIPSPLVFIAKVANERNRCQNDQSRQGESLFWLTYSSRNVHQKKRSTTFIMSSIKCFDLFPQMHARDAGPSPIRTTCCSGSTICWDKCLALQ